jgi:argininosuccinate lyase
MALWNGRFKSRLDPRALRFSSSLGVDRRLFREDIEGSIAHVTMLARRKILTKKESSVIVRALGQIRKEIEEGKFAPGGGRRFEAEDIHMAIESRLIEKTGATGGKLHTARSRNDQIALDERLYLRSAIDSTNRLISRLQQGLLRKAVKHQDLVVPGYTHLQHAQPILFSHQLLCYISMLDRDRERFTDCLKRVSRSPLGAGALAGTSFPIDRSHAARILGFPGLVLNSIDAVSDRDVQIEFLACCAITMMHLSRFAEELVLWSSPEWDFVEWGDAFATGSSIMPQKKNPDMAELVRGKTGRVYGDLLALLTIMKGLPLAYNRDMQEDKEPLFDAADTVSACLGILASLLGDVKFRTKRPAADSQADQMLATELADYLVRKGLPFRKAHSIVGSIVRTSQAKNRALKDIELKEYRRFSRLFGKDLYRYLDPRASLRNKKSSGSTSPGEVRKALRFWGKKLTARHR